MIRCDLDATNCAYADISAGAPAGSAVGWLNESAGSLLTAGVAWTAPYDVVVHRSALDGSSPSYVSFAGTQGPPNPSFVRGADPQQLLFVTNGSSSARGATLFRCAPDATGCSHGLLAGSSFFVTSTQNAVLDAAHGELLVAGRATGDALLRCRADGSGCSTSDIDPHVASLGPYGSNSPSPVAALLDAPHRRLLVPIDISHGTYWPDDLPGLAVVCLP